MIAQDSDRIPADGRGRRRMAGAFTPARGVGLLAWTARGQDQGGCRVIVGGPGSFWAVVLPGGGCSTLPPPRIARDRQIPRCCPAPQTRGYIRRQVRGSAIHPPRAVVAGIADVHRRRGERGGRDTGMTITAIAEGTATITVTATDTGDDASCRCHRSRPRLRLGRFSAPHRPILGDRRLAGLPVLDSPGRPDRRP